MHQGHVALAVLDGAQVILLLLPVVGVIYLLVGMAPAAHSHFQAARLARASSGAYAESMLQRSINGKDAGAWLLARKPWIVPIPGTRRPERLDENVGAARVELTPSDLAEIEKVYAGMKLNGLSPRTIEYVHTVLHSALKHAVARGMLARNPAHDAVRPKKETGTPPLPRLRSTSRQVTPPSVSHSRRTSVLGRGPPVSGTTRKPSDSR